MGSFNHEPFALQLKQTVIALPFPTIDEYSMMSHRQGNAKLEYNGVFRAQLCMITRSKSVK